MRQNTRTRVSGPLIMYQLCRSVSGIADAEWQKITHLIYLDTFLPGDGESLNDLAGPERAAADHGDGWLVPPAGRHSRYHAYGRRQWIESLARSHPLKTMTEKLSLAGNRLKSPKKSRYWRRKNPARRSTSSPTRHETRAVGPRWIYPPIITFINPCPPRPPQSWPGNNRKYRLG